MGVTADRHDYIEDAISHGASAVVVSKDITCSVPTIRVEDTNQATKRLKYLYSLSLSGVVFRIDSSNLLQIIPFVPK